MCSLSSVGRFCIVYNSLHVAGVQVAEQEPGILDTQVFVTPHPAKRELSSAHWIVVVPSRKVRRKKILFILCPVEQFDGYNY